MADSIPTADETQSFSFKAETKQLLNILIHSLYKDHEVFLRELLSNASDALNRVRFEMVTNQDVLDPKAELSVRLTVDKEARLLTIQDTGIGMTKDEIIENLGTIAQSGARKFIEATQDKKVLFRFHGGGMGAGDLAVVQTARESGQLVCPGRRQLSNQPGGDDRAWHENRDQAQGRICRVCRRIPPEKYHPQAFRLHRLSHLPG
jgi:hypothetical protein